MATLGASQRKHKVTIVGSGNWGSTIAKIVAENIKANPNLFEPEVRMWVFEENITVPESSKHYDSSSELSTKPQKLTQLINHFHENVKYLPDIALPHNVVADSSLQDSVKDATILVFNLPHQFIGGICDQLKDHILPYARGVSCIKGVKVSDDGVSLFSESIGSNLGIYCGALSGANIANEVAQEKFSETTVAYDPPPLDSRNPTPQGPTPSSSHADLTQVQHKDSSGSTSKVKLLALPSDYLPIDHQLLKTLFHRPYFHVRMVSDVAGVSLGGALKNIVAIGTGFVDGQGWGDNAKAAIMRVGLLEMVKFGKEFFGGTVHAGTFTEESCGVADLITSCSGGRNHRCAKLAVERGVSVEEVEKTELNGQMLQGTLTAREVNGFLKSRGQEADFPLFTAIYRAAIHGTKGQEILRNRADEGDLKLLLIRETGDGSSLFIAVLGDYMYQLTFVRKSELLLAKPSLLKKIQYNLPITWNLQDSLSTSNQMAPETLKTSHEVYLLPLTDEGAPDVPGTYIYLPPPTNPPYVVRFAIHGTSSICRKGSLLQPDFNRTLEIDIPIVSAGAFAFYNTYTPLPEFSTSPVPTPEPTKTLTYYIDVSPKLTINDEPLPIDALSVFSVISKFMGRYPMDWDKHLRGIGQRGYNMVHFTPLVQRGRSNSPYSIYDQLSFDPECFPQGEKDVAELVSKMEKEHGLLGLTDVVWNHTADNSPWLEEHPEAGYNIETAPWLESALELDNALLEFSMNLANLGLPTMLSSVEDLLKVMNGIKEHVIDSLKLWEYYVINAKRDAEAAAEAWVAGEITFPEGGFGASDIGGPEGIKNWSLEQKANFLLEKAVLGIDRLGKRYHRRIDPKIGAAFLTAMFGKYDGYDYGSADKGAAQNEFSKILDELNLPLYREYDADAAEIMEQVFNRVKYIRLEENGPKLGEITEKNPLVESYFTRLPLNATTQKHHPRSLALVNNGWIWNADAMKDNAGSTSRAYLRREVIAWGDCVKLRYGSSPADNPFLWDFMARYTRLMAKYFTGFRIDNCHSTPLVVAEYLLDEARKVRPDVAIFAELFTGSEEMDFVFVERLGISALIREAMQAWSTAELSRLVHRHGGIPIGSFEVDEVTGSDILEFPHQANGTASPKKEAIRRIKQSPVHALFMDCTHDNEVPAQKRDARDTLPNAALVSLCACATGSVMGYDEIYPKLVDLVHETRLYSSSSSDGEVKIQSGEGGIGGIKKLLNQLHTTMGTDGYDETHVHHEGQYITVHRVHPKSRKGIFLIAHTAYPGYGSGDGPLKPTRLVGTEARRLGSWQLEVDSSDEAKAAATRGKTTLKGLPSRVVDFDGISLETNDVETVITLPDAFPPGSIALFETWIPGAEHSEGLDVFVTSGAKEAFKDLNLVDLNFILYRCESEERDVSENKDGVYTIPGYGSLVYAGLQGWWSVLREVITNNNLGHPICAHLRNGQWALDYIVGRLQRTLRKEGFEHLSRPAAWLQQRFDAIRKVPSFLLPRYFALVIRTAYLTARERALGLMDENMREGQEFVQSLAMVSVQQTGYMKSASLWPEKSVPSLAAGLPHFSSSWARCWGRDVFISLRGLYLATGRYAEAREHILAFASVLKHGMIPNLLSDGKLPRYNSRDSIWFFLQNIQDFTNMVPDGIGLLQEKVPRRFLPYNDTWFEYEDPRAYSQSSTIEDIIQEALQRHATGISFREANAGPKLDMQMKPEGFQIDIKVDWGTGIIFGGNQNNCGTWMDKMGESEKAGSKGVPGTPRDGAAIEITGLLYSTLTWVDKLHEQGKYKYEGISTGGRKSEEITFADWSSRIKQNFERCYYVPRERKDDSSYDVNPKIINRRGIYKDLYKAGKEFEDYQLRANFPIAMTVAPNLFSPEKALYALSIADSAIRGPTGMATLDPIDLNYRPYYNNAEDSNDFATSKGRNYHQGPEWLWPTGFFLRALLKFDLMRRKTKDGRTESFQQITRRLAGCKKAIAESPWAGLTELTNKNGEFCGDSSPTQAWSAGCLLDLFHDASELSIEQTNGTK
ncbi:MAG: hypothetical protein M1827_003055 [Pycnora praestabilis]|nr:MAG: hypothetical protein M1827_003055 [Pycnora praestabilis]